VGILNLFYKKNKKMPRKKIFGGVPTRNPSITTEPYQDGLRLTISRDQTVMPWYVRLMPKPPPTRTFEMDHVGALVWELCDGTHTIAQIADVLADEKKLELKEAEVALVNYLRTLAKRGIIAIKFEDEGKK